MPRLSLCRSGRPSSFLPSAPRGAVPPPSDSSARRRACAEASRARFRRPAVAAVSVCVLLGLAALLGAPQAAQGQTTSTVTGIALTSTPVYGFDRDTYSYRDEVEATVTFSPAVDITGTPQLELDFDGAAKAAACATGTNTTTMVCSYSVARGDSAPDGIAIAANKLTGGTITATGSTTAADLTHMAVPIDIGHKVDAIPPTLITTDPDAPTTSPDGTKVILTFSENIRRVNRNLITIEADGATLSTTAAAASQTETKAVITLATALTAAATNLTVTLRSNAVSDDFSNGIRAVAASVINAVTPPPSPPPPEELKARRGDGEVHLEWEPGEAYATDPDLAYQLRYGADGGEYGPWADIPGGRNARSRTVTGLENGTRYAFELRLRRESGIGTAAEIRQTPEAPRWSVSTNRRSVHEGEDVTLSIATSNAVGFYSAAEPLTLAVIGQIEFAGTTIEGADPEDYEIRVDGTKVQGHTENITFFDYDAISGNDPFPAQHFDLQVPVGSTSLDVTVKVLADGDEEDQETMSFMVFRGEEWVNSGPAWGKTGVNIERSDAGVVKQLAVADAEATEGEDPSLDFVVTLAPPADWTVTVAYATADGTATAGADYMATNGTLTFAPNETEKTVSVTVIDDTVEDTPETLTLELSGATPSYNRSSRAWGMEDAGVLIADAVATGTIRNTEDQAAVTTVTVSFGASSYTAIEGSAAATVTVALDADPGRDVTIPLTASPAGGAAAEDYTVAESVTFAGGGALSQTVVVTAVADDTAEEGESVMLGFGALPDGVEAGATTSAAVTLADAAPEAVNTAPTGLPTITGTPQVGKTLTASVDKIVDADGLASPDFAYQWVSNNGTADSDIEGATNASYTPVAADADKTLKVRVTFTDDGGTEETLVSVATDAVVVPLTASFEDVPAAHDGSSTFTFRVRFNVEPRVSYKVLRDESFAVTGGTVQKARRVNGRNDLREIHVKPSGVGDITVTLPGGRACGTEGAICTADDKVLSNTATATVQGPPTLNVADARVEEGTDATLDFVVTLSRVATGPVTVAYATTDGSATAGADYTTASGTLTFVPGTTEQRVSVPVLNDAVDDGGETLTLTLSNASGAWIEDGTATGTIENSDPLQRAWLARFGRTVGTHVTDAISDRLRGGSLESHLTIGGQRMPFGKQAAEQSQAAASGTTDESGGSALLQGVVRLLGLNPAQHGSASDDSSASRPRLNTPLGQSPTPHIDLRRILLGSSFRLALGADAADSSHPRLTAWGRFAGTQFDGNEPDPVPGRGRADGDCRD